MNSTNNQGTDFLYELLALSGGHQATESMSETSSLMQDDKLAIPFNEVREEVVKMKTTYEREYSDTSFILTKSKSPTAQRIFRAHFLSKMLPKLEWIAQNHIPKKTVCANHISSLFEHMLNLFKNNPEDPFSSYIVAVFDGLSFDDFWISADKDVFKTILSQVVSLGKRDLSDYKEIDKAILKLEKMGLNTTPY